MHTVHGSLGRREDVSLKHETFLFHLSSSEDTISGILPAPWFSSEKPNRFHGLRRYSGLFLAKLYFKHFEKQMNIQVFHMVERQEI